MTFICFKFLISVGKIKQKSRNDQAFRDFYHIIVGIVLSHDDLFTIVDVEALARLSNALSLEGVPNSLAFGEGWGEVLDARRTIFIVIADADRASASEYACG